jgi:hypothetical protein
LKWFSADNSAVLQNEAVLLYQDERFGFKLKKNVDIINHRYLRGLFEDDFMEKIKWLQANLQKHRLNNFMIIAAASYF